MTDRKTLGVLLAILCLGACGVEQDTTPASQAERDVALRESAFGGLVEPMDRAQELQQLQIDRKRELDAAIDN
jgi:hypothetical protein